MGLRRSAHYCPRHPPVNLLKAQRKIFAKNMTPERLAKIMNTEVGPMWNPSDVRGKAMKHLNYYYTSWSSRYKFVNFDRIKDPRCDTSAKTIEFRQHTGTVDFNEISQWAFFVLSLVRLAGDKPLKIGLPAFGIASEVFARCCSQRSKATSIVAAGALSRTNSRSYSICSSSGPSREIIGGPNFVSTIPKKA